MRLSMSTTKSQDRVLGIACLSPCPIRHFPAGKIFPFVPCRPGWMVTGVIEWCGALSPGEGCPGQLGNRVTPVLQSSLAILIIVACLQRVYKRFFPPCFCCCPCSNGEVGQLPECHPAPLLCGVHSEVKNEEQKLKLRSLQVHCKQMCRAI